jgi:hypothetical protein
MGYDLYTGEYVGDPIVEGFKISVDVTYDSLVTIGKLQLNGEPLQINDPNADYTITDFTLFGFNDGFANTSLTLYGGAGGSLEPDLLKQDYELRWTGVLTDTVINGKSITITQSGGSIITLFGASFYSLADHPLNPNPGVEQSIVVRVPFEVWNFDNNEQVNAVFWDRSGNPTVNGSAVWNTLNREYIWIVNTSYDPDVIDVTSQIVADSATWNLVIYKSTFTNGDVIKVTYFNSIEYGIDLFTFTTPDPNSVEDKFTIRSYRVFQNYPNPFNPTTKITYQIPELSSVTLKVFDVLGNEIETLVNEEKPAGKYEVEFSAIGGSASGGNAANLSSGVYFYQLRAGGFVQTKKMILTK